LPANHQKTTFAMKLGIHSRTGYGFDVRDFQLKKYPKISCSAGILPANHQKTTFAMKLGIHSWVGYGFDVRD